MQVKVDFNKKIEQNKLKYTFIECVWKYIQWRDGGKTQK